MSKKICFIIVWYGNLPPYFFLFFDAIRQQPFDVLFITNKEPPENLPSNFIWRQIEWKEMIDEMSKKLGAIAPSIPAYKLCDFKPCFGLVYQEWLAGYDFWGWLDTDIVMGKFENFITSKMLDNYDIISGIKEYISGSFCIIRNNPFCNELFLKSKSWNDVLTNSNMLGFDECSKLWKSLKEGNDIFSLQTPIQSFTEVLLLETKNGLRSLFSDMIIEPSGFEPVQIINGSIFYQRREYLLLHLIYFKTRDWFLYNILNYQTAYYINGFGISKKKPTKFNFIFMRNCWRTIYFRTRLQFRKLQ